MNSTMMKWMLAGALGIFIANVPAAEAQSTLGGAKTQQNKIGGVAKPPPVIGGATIRTPAPPTPPKPGPVVNIAKPTSPGMVTPAANTAALGQAPGPHPNPPVTPPNKGGPVVTSNLKCASGACASKGPKP
jgi:hypothetical protein